MFSARIERLFSFYSFALKEKVSMTFRIHCEIFPDEMKIAERVALNEVAISKDFATKVS